VPTVQFLIVIQSETHSLFLEVS